MINVKNLTGGGVEEQGVFDELMRSLNSQIDTQYSNGRIQGADYAQSYVGLTQVALQVGSQYALQAPLVTQQELLAQQNIINAKKQGLLLDEALLKAAIDTELAAKQVLLMAEQILKVNSETALVGAQSTLTGKQTAKLAADISLIGDQQTHLAAQSSLLGQQLTNAAAETANIEAREDKIIAETGVLTAKKWTEQAQRLDTVDMLPVAGIIGKQKALYENQALGFIRDAEQKAAKIHGDFFTVVKSTSGGDDDSLYGAAGPQIKAVMDKLVIGIDVTPVPPAV